MDEPTKEQWLELHEAFREYCQATPWQWLDDLDIVTVEHPSREQKGYCVVLGSGGMEYGLAVYLGDEGLAGCLALMSGAAEVGSLESLNMTNAVSAMLADREELSRKELESIRNLGLKYRGRGRWPLFQNFTPGYLPWQPESDEAVFLTWALRSITDLAVSLDKGELTLRREGPLPMFLTRTLHDGQWRNGWGPLAFPLPPPVEDYPDSERLRELGESKTRDASSWELGMFYIHAPFRRGRGRGARPHFPLFAMAVHTDSMFMIPEHFMEPSPSDTDRQELLVKLLERMPALPSEIVVDTPRLAQIVDSVTAPLGITLSVDDTPALWTVREELLEFLGEKDEEYSGSQ